MYKQIKQNLNKIIPMLFLLVMFIVDCIIQIKYSVKLLDSDMASEMVLSDLLNREHSILSENWYYSTEIRVTYLQWLFRVGLFLFPHNWHRARVLSIILALLIMVLIVIAIFATIRKLEFGIWVAALMLCPGGFWYFWQTIFGGAYISWIILSLIYILFIFLINTTDQKLIKAILTISMFCFALISGLNGVKILMICYVPVFIALCTKYLIDIQLATPPVKKKNLSNVFFTAIALLGAVIGFLINTYYLAEKYHYKSYNDNRWNDKGILESLKWFIESYGYHNDVKVFSLEGITSAIGLAFGVAIIIVGIQILRKYDKLDYGLQLLSIISIVEIAFSVFVYGYMNGEPQYYQPIVMYGLIILIIAIYLEFSHIYTHICSLAFIILAIISIGTVKNQIDNPTAANTDMEKIVWWLSNAGYDQGFATFWMSNAIRELSNGEIEVWTLTENGSIDEWLQEVDHQKNLPQGRCFFLIKGREDSPENMSLYGLICDRAIATYGDDNYTIYEINAEEIKW